MNLMSYSEKACKNASQFCMICTKFHHKMYMAFTEFPIPAFMRFRHVLFWEFPCPAWAVSTGCSGQQAGELPKLIATEYRTQGAEPPYKLAVFRVPYCP